MVAEAAEEPGDFRFLYPLEATLVEKIETVAQQIYGADGIDIAPEAAGQLRRYEELGYGRLPGRHRQDPPVAVVGPDPARRPDRLADAGA